MVLHGTLRYRNEELSISVRDDKDSLPITYRFRTARDAELQAAWTSLKDAHTGGIPPRNHRPTEGRNPSVVTPDTLSTVVTELRQQVASQNEAIKELLELLRQKERKEEESPQKPPKRKKK